MTDTPSGPERVKVWAGVRWMKRSLGRERAIQIAQSDREPSYHREAWLVFAPHDADPIEAVHDTRRDDLAMDAEILSALEAERDALKEYAHDKDTTIHCLKKDLDTLRAALKRIEEMAITESGLLASKVFWAANNALKEAK